VRERDCLGALECDRSEFQIEGVGEQYGLKRRPGELLRVVGGGALAAFLLRHCRFFPKASDLSFFSSSFYFCELDSSSSSEGFSFFFISLLISSPGVCKFIIIICFPLFEGFRIVV
jgi:hypothetical protein